MSNKPMEVCLEEPEGHAGIFGLKLLTAVRLPFHSDRH
jgi:hypothetical protein